MPADRCASLNAARIRAATFLITIIVAGSVFTPTARIIYFRTSDEACALRFFYGITLGQKEAFERIISGKEPEKLPPVLNSEVVVRFLEAVPGLRNRVALATAYAAGLRIGEVARLKVAAIDSRRMLLHVENGKGGRDRYTMLSPRLLEMLRAYWKRARPTLWLFPGQEPGSHVSVGALQSACRAARRRARIGKRVTAHSLRHSFATHLLESGTEIRSFRSCSATPIWTRRPATPRWRAA